MDAIYADIVSRIVLKYTSHPDRRLLVAIAGPPGSGKSTVAAKVVEMLNKTATRLVADGSILGQEASKIWAVAIPVDGFHFPRSYLDTLPNHSEAYIRRGAPWTFDVDGIIRLVGALKDSSTLQSSARSTIYAPSFDHALKDPIIDDIQISPDASIVILEGNYLLLDKEPWREISELVDVRVFVDVDVECARARVARRHVQAGIEDSFEKGQARFDSNDALNGDLIRKNLTRYDVRVESFDCFS